MSTHEKKWNKPKIMSEITFAPWEAMEVFCTTCQWISVKKDPLPDNETVIVTGDGGYALAYLKKTTKRNGQVSRELIEQSTCCYGSVEFEVTHWMPLPEAPREE